MHRLGRAHDLAAERFADRLVAKADAEDGNLAGSGLDEIKANAGFFRRTGTGREHNCIGIRGEHGGACDLVIAVDAHFLTQFTEIVH